MRQGPNPKRGRGRGTGRKAPNNRTQTFDSNGPSVRVRGNAFQVQEKYLALARDAASAGDRVAAENYFQHAEHYLRIINAANAQAEARREQQQGNGEDQGDQSGGGDRGRRARNGGDDDQQPSEHSARGDDDDDDEPEEQQEKPARAKRGNGRGRLKKPEVQAGDEGETEDEPLTAPAGDDEDGKPLQA